MVISPPIKFFENMLTNNYRGYSCEDCAKIMSFCKEIDMYYDRNKIGRLIRI